MAASQSKNEMKCGVVVEHHLLCVSPTEVSANDAKRIDVFLPVELVVWLLACGVGGLVGFRKD
jgi:hypothetical protein